MVKILVSGSVAGRHASLFAAVTKAEKKSGPFAACFCVGAFLGGDLDLDEAAEARALDALAPSPVPIYYLTGAEAVDSDRAARFAAKGARWLGRSGCDEIGGLRVAYLGGGGAAAGAAFDAPAPDDGSDAPVYVRDDVEGLAIAAGSFLRDGGCDVLLTAATGANAGSCARDDGDLAARVAAAGSDTPLGAALADLKCSYHFAAAAAGDAGWSLPPYRCGAGNFSRLARPHALPARGQPKSLRAFSIDAWAPPHHDLDTADGAREASLLAGALRGARRRNRFGISSNSSVSPKSNSFSMILEPLNPAARVLDD